MQYDYTLMRDSDVRFGFWFINLLFSQSLIYTCLHNPSECLRIYVSMIQQRCVGDMFVYKLYESILVLVCLCVNKNSITICSTSQCLFHSVN